MAHTSSLFNEHVIKMGWDLYRETRVRFWKRQENKDLPAIYIIAYGMNELGK